MASRYPRSRVMTPCCGDPDNAEASNTVSVAENMCDWITGSGPAGVRLPTGSNVGSDITGEIELRICPLGSLPSVTST
jgi:hypothetical protein